MIGSRDERYAGEECLSGAGRHGFRVSQQHALRPGLSCLAAAGRDACHRIARQSAGIAGGAALPE